MKYLLCNFKILLIALITYYTVLIILQYTYNKYLVSTYYTVVCSFKIHDSEKCKKKDLIL